MLAALAKRIEPLGPRFRLQLQAFAAVKARVGRRGRPRLRASMKRLADRGHKAEVNCRCYMLARAKIVSQMTSMFASRDQWDEIEFPGTHSTMRTDMIMQSQHDSETLNLMGLSLEKAWQEVAAKNLHGNPTALQNAMARRIKSAVLIGVRDIDRLALLAIDAVEQR